MDILFGFGGRLGRLNYFLLTLALAFVTTLLIFLLISALAPHYVSASGASSDGPPSGMILLIAAIIMPFFTWFSLALQAKRLRDIGWRPLYVIPGWIAAICIDWLIAILIPSLAIGDGDHTIAGLLINLAMVGCLLFWPSGPDQGDYSDPRKLMPDRPTGDRATVALATAPAPAPRGGAAPAGFGRRIV